MGAQDQNNDNRPLTQIRPRVGLHNVGSYQVAGTPWITSSMITQDSTLTCSFPWVSKNVTIYNTGNVPVRVHFADDGLSGVSTDHYFTIRGEGEASTSGSLARFTFDVKCASVFITEPNAGHAGIQVYASLTGIPTGSMFALSYDGVVD